MYTNRNYIRRLSALWWIVCINFRFCECDAVKLGLIFFFQDKISFWKEGEMRMMFLACQTTFSSAELCRSEEHLMKEVKQKQGRAVQKRRCHIQWNTEKVSKWCSHLSDTFGRKILATVIENFMQKERYMILGCGTFKPPKQNEKQLLAEVCYYHQTIDWLELWT